MINKKDFNKIIKELESFDEKRELLIKTSRKLLKLSKRLIYSIHRVNPKETAQLLKEIKKLKSKIDKLIKKDILLSFEGSYSEAMQEYAEAMCFYGFVKNEKSCSNLFFY